MTIVPVLSGIMMYCYFLASSLVFGVPLKDLVTREGGEIPFIIKKIVEHIEQNGKVNF